MADRGMTAAVLTEIAESQNKPFHLVEIYFTSGTVYFTDSDRDITWNSNTYSAAGHFLTFSEINEQNALTVSDIEVQLSGVDRTYLTEILSETFMDRNLIIRKGFFDDSNAVIVDPIIIYSGKMDQPNIIETSESCTISVTVANLFIDFTKTTGRYTNAESQKLFFPTDEGFAYAHQIIKEINWGKEGFGSGGLPPAPPVIPPGFPGNPFIIPSFVIPTIPIYIPSTIVGGGISVTAGGTTLVFDAYDHGFTTGTKITIADALAVGEVPATSINKEHTVTVINDNKFTVPITETITTSVTNAGGSEYTFNEVQPIVPFITTNTTANNEHIVSITAPKHEVKKGNMVTFEKCGTTGGIPDTNINGTHYVNNVDENSFEVEIKEFKKVTAPPIKTTSGSSTVKVEIANNTKNIGDTVVIAGAVDTGGIVAANINGTQTITAATENTVSFTSAGTASSTTKGGGNSVTVDSKTPVTAPFETTSGSTTVTFNQGNHGLAIGDKFTVFNAMPVAGYDPSEINKEHTVVSVPNANSVTFTTTSTANATTSGGGSSSVVFLPVKATSVERGGGVSSTIGMPTSVL